MSEISKYSPERQTHYLNEYVCKECNNEWDIVWDCSCTDECSNCKLETDYIKSRKIPESLEYKETEEIKTTLELLAILENIAKNLDNRKEDSREKYESLNALYWLRKSLLEGIGKTVFDFQKSVSEMLSYKDLRDSGGLTG